MKVKLVKTVLLLAILLITPLTSVKANSGSEISTFAKQFTTSPYKFGGTTPLGGFDCSGFIQYVYGNFDIALPRTTELQFNVGEPVAESDLQPGDIVFFKDTYKAGISHAGVYLGDNHFISAENERTGVAIAKLFSHPYWGVKYAGAKRVTQSSITPNSTPGIQPTIPKNIFADLAESHPAYAAIINLNGKGIIEGFQNATFKPEDFVTRGQAAAMLNRVLKLSASKDVIFTDVGKENRFAEHIAAMNEAGILKGYETGIFGINEQLTRVQLALIVDRAFGLQKKAMSKVKAASLYYDVPSTYWAFDSINALKILDQTGIFQTQAYELGKEVTRAEFSAAVYSAIEPQ